MAPGDEPQHDDDFMTRASKKQSGLVSELIGFLRANKKWWLAPILVAIVLLGILVMLGGTAAAPFIYTLF